MATELKIEATRQDTFRVNPDDVKVGVDSRIIPAANQDEIDRQRAVDMFLHGQLEPAGGHKDAKGNLVLDLGFTRRRAVQLIRAGFTAIDPTTGQERTFHDPNFMLWVAVDTGEAEEKDWFIKGIVENQSRSETTDLQEALAQDRLRTEYGYNDSQIAAVYGYTNTNRVSALKRLASAPKNIQQSVHNGKLALYAALDLLAIPAKERNEVLTAATAENGRIKGEVIRKQARKLFEAAGESASKVVAEAVGLAEAVAEESGVPSIEEATAAKQGKKGKKGKTGAAPASLTKCSVKDFKDFATDLNATIEVAPQVKELFAQIVRWFGGEVGDKGLWNKIDAVTEATGFKPPKV